MSRFNHFLAEADKPVPEADNLYTALPRGVIFCRAVFAFYFLHR